MTQVIILPTLMVQYFDHIADFMCAGVGLITSWYKVERHTGVSDHGGPGENTTETKNTTHEESPVSRTLAGMTYSALHCITPVCLSISDPV